MIEDLFKKGYTCFTSLIIIFNLIFSYQEESIARQNINYNYHPICKNICFDLNLSCNEKLKPFVGLYWLVSHNLLINWKTSLNNYNNNDIKSYNVLGIDIDLKRPNNLTYILSFNINKLRHTSYGNYTWYQNSINFSKKKNLSIYQIILDRIYDDSWDILKVDMIYGREVYKKIFLYIGISKEINHYDNILYSFLTLNFNI